MPAPDRSRRETVLTAAAVRAAERLGIPDVTLGAIIGVSVPMVSHLKSGSRRLADGSEPFAMAQLFLRLYRGLSAIVGGDDGAARSWLAAENRALRARPIDRMQTAAGLVETATYLDARRAVV